MIMLKIRRRIASKSMRLVQVVRIAWYWLLSTNRCEGGAVLYQPMQLAGSGTIFFAPGVRVGVFPSPDFLNTYAYVEARNPSASVKFGVGTWINNGFRCIADHSSITIGANCLIGANVEVLDSDFHGLQLGERRMSKPEWAAPVVIEDDVFVGSNVRILKGVRIGTGAVIANGAVVVHDIPEMTIAGGVPARVLKRLHDE